MLLPSLKLFSVPVPVDLQGPTHSSPLHLSIPFPSYTYLFPTHQFCFCLFNVPCLLLPWGLLTQDSYRLSYGVLLGGLLDQVLLLPLETRDHLLSHCSHLHQTCLWVREALGDPTGNKNVSDGFLWRNCTQSLYNIDPKLWQLWLLWLLV
jgi:hypothetical protein